MTEYADSSLLPYPDAGPLPRCCPRHEDWPTLSEHLLVEFPALEMADIVHEVREARTAVAGIGLNHQDALATGELIARHNLALRAGLRTDAARLDPERHVRTSPPT